MEINDESFSSGSSYSRSSTSSSDNDKEAAPYKISKLELEHPIKFKLLKYMDQFAAAVKSGNLWSEENQAMCR